ncbi:MAG TPA: hypothetical protein VEB39_07880 [Sphingomicrobium sp.]|nr:hypothetical protein [Sphingomicrobium sp.]
MLNAACGSGIGVMLVAVEGLATQSQIARDPPPPPAGSFSNEAGEEVGRKAARMVIEEALRPLKRK